MYRRLGIALESCDAEVSLLRKALTAGLLMNAVQLVDTANDISDPSSAGINVYRILRSTGPGAAPTYCRPPYVRQTLQRLSISSTTISVYGPHVLHENLLFEEQVRGNKDNLEWESRMHI